MGRCAGSCCRGTTCSRGGSLLREEGNGDEHHGHKETTLPSQVLHRLCPLRCVGVAPALADATLKKTLPGTRHFFDSDYTRARRMSRLEICIGQIRFSDSLPGRPPGQCKAAFLPYTQAATPHPGNFFTGYSCLPARPSYNASRSYLALLWFPPSR